MRTNETEKMKELLTELENSPVVEKLRAEKAKQTLTERRAAAARVKAADDELGKVLPSLQQALDAATAALKAHDDKRKALLENVRQAQAAVYASKLQHDNERRRAEGELLESYDPAIDEAREFFQQLHDRLRHKSRNVQVRDGERYVNEKKEQFFFTNAPAINAAIVYCRDAMREVEAMKLLPAFDAGRIEALKKGLPNTDELTENKSIVRAPYHWNRNPLAEGRGLLEAIRG